VAKPLVAALALRPSARSLCARAHPLHLRAQAV